MPERIHLNLASARATRKDLSDGGFVLTSPIPLNDYASNICEFLHCWADETPERIFIAERDKIAEEAGASRNVCIGVLPKHQRP